MSRRKQTAVEVDDDDSESSEEMRAPPAKRRATGKKAGAKAAASRAAGSQSNDDDVFGSDDESSEEKPRAKKASGKKAGAKASGQRAGKAAGAKKAGRRMGDAEADLMADGDDDDAVVDNDPAFGDEDDERLNRITPEEKEKLITDTIRFCLFRDLHKKPIKQQEIVKEVITSKYTKKDRGITKVIWKEASMRLLDVFGWELKEMPNFSKTGEVSSSKLFAVVVRPELQKYLESIKVDIQTVTAEEEGLLLAILGYLFVSEAAEEAALYDFLEQMGLVKGLRHTRFGEWEPLIAKFIKQHYITALKPDTPQGDKKYTIGPRAHVEIGKPTLLIYVARIIGQDPDPTRLRELRVEQAEKEAEFLEKTGDKEGAQRAAARAQVLAAGPGGAAAAATTTTNTVKEVGDSQPSQAEPTATPNARGARGRAKAAAASQAEVVELDDGDDGMLPQRGRRRGK